MRMAKVPKCVNIKKVNSMFPGGAHSRTLHQTCIFALKSPLMSIGERPK